MRTFGCLLVVVAVVFALGASASGDDVGFVVIVNSSNPVTSLTRSQLSSIFLKQESAWPDGQVIVPVDQEESSPVRAEFSRVVMKRPVAAVKSFWQKQIFSGAAVPPVEKASSEDVAIYVSTIHGAVGYVGVVLALSSGKAVVKLPAGVKVVRLIE
jgi:ABC-type phosphate transport system substrate-binding protein